jgi:hypothetical protein
LRHLIVSTLLASALSLTSGAAFAASEAAGTEYFLINGPDYRQVTKGVFEQYRNAHSCVRIDTKFYPASGSSAAVNQSLCYL